MAASSKQFPKVIIRDGYVSEVRHQRADGVSVTRHDPPLHQYFLDYVDDDGAAAGVWEGSSYAAACAAAHEWQAEGIHVEDQVSDEGGRA